MSRTMFVGLLGLGLGACAVADAREPGGPNDSSWTLEHRVLDRSLAAGTLVEATSRDLPSGHRSHPGDPLSATVSADVRNASRWIVIPAGSVVELRVASRKPRPDSSSGTWLLDVTSVTVSGQAYPVRATGEVTAVAAAPRGETRILFVLEEGFTAWRRRPRVPASK